MKTKVWREIKDAQEGIEVFRMESDFFSGRVAFCYSPFYPPIPTSLKDASGKKWHCSNGVPLLWEFPTDWFVDVQTAVGQIEKWLDIHKFFEVARREMME